jgi:hypothetical protein
MGTEAHGQQQTDMHPAHQASDKGLCVSALKASPFCAAPATVPEGSGADKSVQEHQVPLAAATAAKLGTVREPQQAEIGVAPRAGSGALLPCCIVAAFDPELPALLRQQLSSSLAACGGRAIAAAPHLGCGANTVVAEASKASQWLQLLMNVVSPAWLSKACRATSTAFADMPQTITSNAAVESTTQKQGQQQHMVVLSMDVAKAVAEQVAAGKVMGSTAGVMGRQQLPGRPRGRPHSTAVDTVSSCTHCGSPNSGSAGAGVPPAVCHQDRLRPADTAAVCCSGPAASPPSDTSFNSSQPITELVLPQGVELLPPQLQPASQPQAVVMMPAAVLTDLVWSVDQPPE